MGLGEFIKNWVVGLYQNTYENMLLDAKINEAMGNGEGAASVVTSQVLEACINDIAPAFVGIGLALSVLFFLIQLVELGTSERLTFEYFIKFFTKLIIAVALIAYCEDLIKGCVNFGNGFMNIISNGNLSPGLTPEEMGQRVSEAFDNASGISWIGLLVSSVFSIGIINIVSQGIAAIVYIIGFTRILELGVRGALMPVALGLMADDGWKGSAGRYIKKFIAICAQGGVLMIIGKISNIAMGAAALAGNYSSEASLSGSFIMLLGVAIATVSVLFKSMSVVNDVFGA